MSDKTVSSSNTCSADMAFVPSLQDWQVRRGRGAKKNAKKKNARKQQHQRQGKTQRSVRREQGSISHDYVPKAYTHARWDEIVDETGQSLFEQGTKYTRFQVFGKRMCSYLENGRFCCAQSLSEQERQLCAVHHQKWTERFPAFVAQQKARPVTKTIEQKKKNCKVAKNKGESNGKEQADGKGETEETPKVLRIQKYLPVSDGETFLQETIGASKKETIAAAAAVFEPSPIGTTECETQKQEEKTKQENEQPVDPQFISVLLDDWQTIRSTLEDVAAENVMLRQVLAKRDQDIIALGQQLSLHKFYVQQHMQHYMQQHVQPLQHTPDEFLPMAAHQNPHLMQYGTSQQHQIAFSTGALCQTKQSFTSTPSQ